MREDEIQRAVFRHLRERPERGVFAFHPKNGGIHQRGRRRGINSGLGVVSGVPDVIVIRGGHAFGLELKADKGKLSMEQVSAQNAMRMAGCTTATVYGLDEAIAQLESWGLLRGVAA